MAHPAHSHKGKEPMKVQEVRPRILLAACGTEAAVGFTNLCDHFSQWADILAVATENAMCFIDISLLPPRVNLYTSTSDWGAWKKLGDHVLHIEHRNWADIMVIAPLSANTLAKISGGLCDNLLTCIVRAWDNGKPLVVAPDMDPLVWKSSLTESQMIGIEDLGVYLIPPVTKIAEGVDRGLGTMEGPSVIVSTVKSILNSKQKVMRQ